MHKRKQNSVVYVFAIMFRNTYQLLHRTPRVGNTRGLTHSEACRLQSPCQMAMDIFVLVCKTQYEEESNFGLHYYLLDLQRNPE